jgi:hypothetical protein
MAHPTRGSKQIKNSSPVTSTFGAPAKQQQMELNQLHLLLFICLLIQGNYILIHLTSQRVLNLRLTRHLRPMQQDQRRNRIVVQIN